jgi:hypothetical protein
MQHYITLKVSIMYAGNTAVARQRLCKYFNAVTNTYAGRLHRLLRTAYLFLNVHNVSNVRQIGILTAEPLAPGPNRLDVEIAIARLKKCKSSGSNEIRAELIQAGGET